MSKDAVKKFFEELENNSVLREKFIPSLADETSQSAITSFAGSNGFSFSEDELQEYCAELSDNMNCNQEVDDKSLANAAGGFHKLTSTLTSILGLGMACAVVSIVAAIKKDTCGRVLSVSGGNECYD